MTGYCRQNWSLSVIRCLIVITILVLGVTWCDRKASLEEDNCRKWNCTLAFKTSRNERKIHVKFDLFDDYKECFPGFILFLRRARNSTDGSVLPQQCGKRGFKNIHRTNFAAPNYTHTYQELAPGNYCILVKPSVGEGKYRPLASGVKELLEPLPFEDITPAPIKLPMSRETSNTHVIVQSVGFVILGVVIVCLVTVSAYLWRKRRAKLRFSTNGGDNPPLPLSDISGSVHPICENLPTISAPVATDEQPNVATAGSTSASPKRQRERVFVLYFHDSEMFEHLIDAFVAFLRRVIDVEVVRDSEFLHRIVVNPQGWIDGMLDEFWPDRRPGNMGGTAESRNKIIIVESEGAARYHNARIRLENALDGEECLDDLAGRALVDITNTMQSLEAYNKLIVVKFDFTSAEHRINCLVPNVRYTIPDHLPYIYRRLHSKRETRQQVEADFKPLDPSSAWEDISEYRDLLRFIESFHNTTSEN